MTELTPVQQYYKGKTVFITGATGFVGKVLLEKLLYSCSELREIIIICRAKREKSPQLRLEEMWKIPIFQRIKDEKPEMLKKVTLLEGDIAHEFLGLSKQKLEYVAEHTNIVYHVAASLKMQGPLSESIDMNLAGTRRALDLARKMKHLESFVYVSTAFCNCDQNIVEEQVYDFPHKPEDLMRLAEWLDEKTLNSIKDDLIHPQPNNYIYTKRLAELYVRDQYEQMPVAIARPSIVTSIYKDPIPGWIDNYNGVVGIMIASGKGVLRSLMCDKNAEIEVVPVDAVITGLIVIPYSINTQKERPSEIPVFNLTQPKHLQRTCTWIMEHAKRFKDEYPLKAVWHPNTTFTMNIYYHWFNVIMFMFLPALFLDMLLTLCGQRRFMMRVHRRIVAGISVLQFFTTRKWNFKIDKYLEICDNLVPEDKEIFLTPQELKDTEAYLYRSCIGGRQYLCKEPLSNVARARVVAKILFILDRFCKIVLCSLIFYWLANTLGLVDYVRAIDPLHFFVAVK
ncbi:putative fatty acyl-CoA reductase CG5065 [Stomoxys calcitrans]|uniref:Fatty acyl-CoA reductase n=1 Tax=Stomoxys calcitrans TaxID=35570 RepID=A0A1I8P8W0_STOCA|nr:putative fatty acyl-CoA reductase CG5065 [Stomoxys calcitrans]XP_013113521.1 putative fatty acyl-CoA reductase CG5065 [Stomoxys calcitrans]XP_013113530.1 putative fatty acyl-CoA reductase CG5065 [Stomoxys calcitrans]